ncbi:Domain of unknown function DUF4468 with TBP-like fold [uncultured Caudovirales phage]|uniref:DUF4468 domain-containing protein n=1 Tax=uncultured Caudovirales phage TaxID=2100421 RepID=A0A6J5KZV2_9CAUD|nr:Domain of unknown function DUF4468 with TBP-like fold [uncultured Caudovirales phage]
MKSLLLFVLLFVSFASSAQEDNYAPSKPGKDIPEAVIQPHEIHFVGIDTVSGTKEELFIKANEWFATAFKNANAVLQLKDKEAGKLLGKGSLDCLYNPKKPWSVPINVQFTVIVDVKDGRYRFEFTDVIAKNYGSGLNVYSIEKPFDYSNKPRSLSFNQEKWEEAVEGCREQIRTLKNSLKATMREKGKDW